MKKLWLLAGMLFGSFALSVAQPYEPMVVEGAHWRYGTAEMTGLPYSEIYDFRLHGDTVVNNKIYKKLYWRVLEADSLSYSPPYRPVFSLHLPVAGLREDTTNKLVYGIYFMDGSFRDNPCPGTSEIVLFDFSYEPGDTVDLCRYLLEPNDTVAYDTVIRIFDTLFFNHQRRVIHTSFDMFLIEGVGGGNKGGIRPEKLKSEIISDILFNFRNPQNASRRFLDHHCVGVDTECEIVTSIGNPLKHKIPTLVYPIPTSSQLRIELGSLNNEHMIEAVSIYNTAGIEVLKNSVLHTEAMLSVEHLPSGIYTLQITFEDIPSQYTKILIN